MSQKAAFIDSLSMPVVAAPMFLISGPQLVIECCKNGIVGTFPALNQRSSEGFEEWLIEIKTALKAFEEETGEKVVSEQNYLKQIAEAKAKTKKLRKNEK